MSTDAGNLFSGKGSSSKAPATPAQPVDATDAPPQYHPPGAAPSPFTRPGEEAPRGPFGRPKRGYDRRLLPNVDVTRGLATMSKEVEVVAEASMSKDDAGALNMRVLDVWGATRFLEGEIMTLMDALYHSVTVNGTSTVMPGRSVIRFNGGEFSMRAAVQEFGNDFRRWGRASADAIRDANERTMTALPDDVLMWDRKQDLLRVAVQRGMQRYPTLCFDTADFCTGLTVPEHLAIAESKKLILASTTNYADTAKAVSKVTTADGFVGTGVSDNAAGRSSGGIAASG